MIDVGTLVMKVDADTKQFNKGIGMVNKGMKSVGGMVKKAAKTAAIGATVAAGAMSAIGLSAVNAAKGFDEEMSKVKAITQSTDEQMKQLDKTAQDLGSSTAFSAKEAAEGMSFLGMAGYDTNQIIAAMPGLLDLAASSGTDLGRTADIVSDAMSAFKLEAKDTGMFADVLAKATASANVTVEDLGESFKTAAPIAGALGFSIEDVSTALGVMGNKGTKASRAGTALRTAMVRIAKAASDNDSELSKMAGGLTNADGSMRDFGDIIESLQGQFAGMTESQKASTAETLFGAEAVAGMLAILDDADGSFSKLNKALEESEGAAKSMAEIMLDNLGGDLTLLGSAVEGAKIKIGRGLTPALRDLIQWVTRNMPKFTDSFLTAFNSIRRFIDNNLMPVFTSISKWWDRNGDTIKAKAKEMWGKVKEGAEKVYTYYTNNVLPVFDRVKAWWDDNGAGVGIVAADLFNGIVTVATTMWKYLSENVIPILEKVATTVIDNWPEIVTVAETTWSAVEEAINPVIDSISTGLIEAIDTLDTTVRTTFPAMGTFFNEFFEGSTTDIKTFTDIVDKLREAIEYLKEAVPFIFDSIEGSFNPIKKIQNRLEDVRLFGELLSFGNTVRERNKGNLGAGSQDSFMDDNSALLRNPLEAYRPPTMEQELNKYGVRPDSRAIEVNINISGNNISDDRAAAKLSKQVTEEMRKELMRFGVKP